ncbi:hypothetical protein BN8_04211 [Fibrisoma limi BUZ 3]|uniref:Uncharacterized protein n=1 Tax=Fibrisoma limi BUZ 3 TaxID=1185876 RepID=I2GM57_9BACT|nr:hypothetical protein BN8_04211 [Fibrisoma limi BUZ 3]
MERAADSINARKPERKIGVIQRSIKLIAGMKTFVGK